MSMTATTKGPRSCADRALFTRGCRTGCQERSTRVMFVPNPPTMAREETQISYKTIRHCKVPGSLAVLLIEFCSRVTLCRREIGVPFLSGHERLAYSNTALHVECLMQLLLLSSFSLFGSIWRLLPPCNALARGQSTARLPEAIYPVN